MVMVLTTIALWHGSGLSHNAASICLVYVHVLEQNKVWVMAVLCVLFWVCVQGSLKKQGPFPKNKP